MKKYGLYGFRVMWEINRVLKNYELFLKIKDSGEQRLYFNFDFPLKLKIDEK